MNKFFKQCELAKQRKNGFVYKTLSWLPERYAVLGKPLKLKFSGGWEDWCVTGVYNVRRDFAYLKKHENNYKHQREVADI